MVEDGCWGSVRPDTACYRRLFRRCALLSGPFRVSLLRSSGSTSLALPFVRSARQPPVQTAVALRTLLCRDPVANVFSFLAD